MNGIGTKFHIALIAISITCVLGVQNLPAADSITAVCLVRGIDEIDVPAQRDGLIHSLLVDRATPVTVGQELASLDDRRARLTLASARARSQASELALDLAETESELIHRLGEDAVYLERFRTHNGFHQRRAERDQAVAEFKLQELGVAQSQIVSPLDGMVKLVHRKKGEWVRQGDKIVTVTRMDRLLVEAFVDARSIPAYRITGATATARIAVTEGDVAVLKELTVKHAAPSIQLDGKYLVWIEIENMKRSDLANEKQWVLRPGLKGQVVIDVSTSPQLTGASIR